MRLRLKQGIKDDRALASTCCQRLFLA